MTTVHEGDPAALASAWLAVDPDPECRLAIEALLASPSELERRFGDRLAFGTAGLRGELGAGPMRMNEVLVRVVAAALATRVADEADSRVVIGYDARHKSDVFARDTARVLAARGVPTTLLPTALPTPVLAFAVRELDAAAGVMVTASHNPRADNGYKVYWRGGAQISPPIDQEISALIDATPLLDESDLAPIDHELITIAGDDLVESYVAAALRVLDPDGSRSARVAYTPLHGVGRDTIMRAFAAAGFAPPLAVQTQAEPDPDFPTTAFPNPEETGVLDPLFELATTMSADVALANDPDADRLAVAVPNGPVWRLLTGDEVGSLLAEHLLSRLHVGDLPPLVLNTVVSSRLLGKIAAHHGAEYVETLTGFKWIMKARSEHPDQQFVMGYEEALGYAISDTVQDKDGVSAALAMTELVSQLTDEGRTLLDLLDDIHHRHGVHVTGQRSIRFEPAPEDPPTMARAMQAARAEAPEHLAGRPVHRLVDLATGSATLPPTDGVVFELDGARVVARPSGTEPKMKVYGELVAAAGDDITASRSRARADLTQLLDAAVLHLTSPEQLLLADLGTGGRSEEGPEQAEAVFAAVPAGAQRAHDLRLVVRCLELVAARHVVTSGTVRAMCAEARRPDPADPTAGPTAAVRVQPALVPLARELTGGSIEVVAMAGAYPSGLSSIEVRCADIEDATRQGADVVDTVLNTSAFSSGRFDEVAADLQACREAAGDAAFRVTIEADELGTHGAIRHAAQLAIDAGAHWIGASTGASAAPTTPASVRAIAGVIAAHGQTATGPVGLAITGDVATASHALGHVRLVDSVLGADWLTPDRLRLGGPGLLGAVLADIVETEASLRG